MLPLSARLSSSTLVDELLPRESGGEADNRSTWGGLQQAPELTVGTSFAHRRVTLILLGANVLSVFIFMDEMDPSDEHTDNVGGVFIVILLIAALSLVQSLGIRHGQQLLSMCRTRGGICGRLLARPLVAVALVLIPVGAFCNSYLATHCALKGCPNLDLSKDRTTPDKWADMKEVACAAQNLLTLIGMVEVVLLLCSSASEQAPRDERLSAQDWWRWGDRRRAQRSHKLVMFFLGLMQPVGVVLSSLDANFLTDLPIPSPGTHGQALQATVAEYALDVPEEANEDGLFAGQAYMTTDDGSGGGGIHVSGANTEQLLIRMIGQPMMVLSLLHWVCLPSVLGWCGCCCSSGNGRGLSFESQRCWSFTGLTFALFFNLLCWFVYMRVPAEDVQGTGDSSSARGSCFWALPGAVVHIYIFCAVALSVLFGPIVRSSRSVYVFGCLMLVGCCIYGIFGVFQFVHLQNAPNSGADLSAAWGRDCDKLLHASPLPMWGLYLRSGQAMLPLAEVIYFCALLSKRTEVRTGSFHYRKKRKACATLCSYLHLSRLCFYAPWPYL